jgi:1-acyl-sn-glycerol-3-phosphate acyltransferase
VRRLLIPLLEALCRVLFTYDCRGEENLPATGPAVVASNHPSYLDPVLLSLQAPRPIRFMAWDALFRVPLLGPLIRALGAFPVDVRRGKGREAYERARSLVEQGEVVGIFPEGKRSQTGWMEPSLREGAARLAWETGAPLVPATIAGAYRAWPHFQSLPRPARIRVRFHEPIDPAPYRPLPEDEALPALLEEVRRRVDRSLLPGVKADLKMNVLYGCPGPPPRIHEWLPPLGLAAFLSGRAHVAWPWLVAAAYIGYLFLDHLVLPQSRLVKWIRTMSPALVGLGLARRTLILVGFPPVPAGAALVAVTSGGLFPYLYEHRPRVMGVVHGLMATLCLEVVAFQLAPDPRGPHVAIPLFLAAYAWEGRTVFWRYAVPVLVGYALVVPWLLGGGPVPLLWHGLAAMTAWVAARVLPRR